MKTKDIVKKHSKREHQSKLLYYTTQSLMGIHDCWIYWLIGSRGRGKSYSVMETFLQYAKKYGQENVKCYYFRISDLSVKAMLANGGQKAIDPLLVRKYNLDLSVHADTLYNNGKPFIYFYPLVSAAKKGKGLAEYDPEFLTPERKDRFIFIIIDEFMMADGVEKKSVGNPVEQFKIYIENILRDQEQLDYAPVKIFGCANSVSECNDFLAQLVGFIPERLGRFILKRKHTVVDNIPNSEEYIKKRANSVGADLLNYTEDANYTNVLKRDLTLLKPKSQPLKRFDGVIKFSKQTQNWYEVWDGNIIRSYHNNTFKKNQVIAMKRYLDNSFNQDLVNSVIERFDAQGFIYSDLITMSCFAADLKMIRAK